MALGYLDSAKLTAIADSIRSKTGKSATMTVDEMPDEIEAIETGGGGSNIVEGEVTITAEKGTVQTIDLSYSGTGYPIACFIWPRNGTFDPDDDTPWYGTIQRYAVGVYSMVKQKKSARPNYYSNALLNNGSVVLLYKSSTSSASNYSSRITAAEWVFNNSEEPTASTRCVAFSNYKTMKLFVANTSYGFMNGASYRYLIVYSQ